MKERAYRKGWAAIGAIALAIAATGTMAADIGALTAKAAAAAKSGDHAAALDALDKALEQVQAEAPLMLKQFTMVKEPAKYFGGYEARAGATFGSGENMYFYVEPKNLVYPRNAKGLYEPGFEVDLEVKGATGEAMKKPKFAEFRLPTKSRVQDFYLNLTLSLTGAPAGKYTVRFIVRDLNSKKSGTVEQVVTLK